MLSLACGTVTGDKMMTVTGLPDAILLRQLLVSKVTNGKIN